jgi:hypothetical protein
LGPAPREAKTTPYAKKSTAKWNMPESYIGESEYLRDTMEDWMLTANWTWYTERIMPWYRTDQIHLQWSEWENNPHYMGVTPHQAMSNVTTQRRTVRKASMLRRGIAFEFEHDFVGTALGRTSFMASLAQMARSVQETANVEVLRALLGCHRFQQVYFRKHGILRDEDLDGYWNRICERFMIAQKDEFGLEKMNTLIEKEQEMYQAKADVWILGREVMDYCSLVPPAKIFYDLGGQEAVDRVNGRGQNGSASAGTMGNVRSLQPERMIADTPVYLAKSFVVDSIGQLDLLSRTVEVGLFNTQIDHTRSFHKYASRGRNIRVYDGDIDDWAEITLADAIQNCVIWDDNGNVLDAFSSGQRRGMKAVGDGDREMANDFLRYGGWDGAQNAHNKQDVEYVGDFDKQWLTSQQLENAGQTVLNAILRARPDLRDKVFGAATPALPAGPQQPFALPQPQQQQPQQNQAVLDTMALFETAVQMLGNDNLFVADATKRLGAEPRKGRPNGPPFSSDASGVVENLYRAFALNNVVNVQPRVYVRAAIGAEAVAAGDVEARHTAFLQNVLGSVVPQSRQGDVASIIARKDEWRTRAAAIESLAVECKKEDPSSISALSDEPSIKRFFKNRVAGYAKEHDAWVSASAASAAPIASSSSETMTIPVGAPLPAGYEYVNPADANRTYKACPSSLRDFSYLSSVFEPAAGSGISVRGGRRLAPVEGRALGNDNGQETARQEEKRLEVRFNNLDRHIFNIANGSAPLVIKWLAILYAGSRFTRDRLLAFDAQDIWVAANFLHLRVHTTHRTRFGIKCASGGRSGYTFFGHSNMEIAHEAARKVGMAHYTAYLSAVVMFPKNVYVVEDLFCEKYLGGMGTSFWSRDEYTKKGANRTRKSIVCTMLPPKMPGNGRLEKRIDIRGHWYTEQTMGLVGADRFERPCYPGAGRTAILMGWWDPIRKSKAVDHASRSRRVAFNYVCHQAVQFEFNPTVDDWGNVTVEQSPYGQNVQPGCGQVRNGALKYLDKPSYLQQTSMRR